MKKIFARALFAGLIFTTTFCVTATDVFAQTASDPKGFFPIEPGNNVIIYYYRHITADTYYSDDAALPNNKYTYNYNHIRVAHYGAIAGVKTMGTAGLTFGDKTMDGSVTGGVRHKSSGVGDLNYKQYFWLIDQDNFKTAIIGSITAPVGEYQSENSSVNMGSNRWIYGVEGGFGYLFLNKWSFELHEAVSIYSPNNDYGASHQKLATDPLYNTTMHLSYDINQHFYITGSTYWLRGGDNQLDGVQRNDNINTFGSMLSLQIHFDIPLQMFIQYAKDLDVKNGFKTDSIQVRLRYGY